MLTDWTYYRNYRLQKTSEELAEELEIQLFILFFFEEGKLKQASALELAQKIEEKYNVDKKFFNFYYNKTKPILPETGLPLSLKYHKNLSKAPNLGIIFGQHIEPHGEYISYHEQGSTANLDNYEYGEISFINPLVIPFSTPEYPSEENSYGWKSFLVAEYGMSGKELSDHLRSRGYDAIITIGGFGPDSISEIVNLGGKKN